MPPETSQAFFAELKPYLARFIPEPHECDVQPVYPKSPDPDAFATDSDTALVQTLAEMNDSKIRAFEAATEAFYFATNGPTVVFGPGILTDEEGPVAHTDREYVLLSEIEAAANAIRSTIETLLT